MQARAAIWLFSRVTDLRDDDQAQGLVEYALIIALVSIGAIAALGFLSGRINTLFSRSGNALDNP